MLKVRNNYSLVYAIIVSLFLAIPVSSIVVPYYGLSARKSKEDQAQNLEKYLAFPPGYYKDDLIPDHTVYLTFDDGPANWTEQILDVLKAQDIKATFFITAQWSSGQKMESKRFLRYKNALQRMVREGHVVGNHTLSHKNLALYSDDGIASELDLNQKMLDDVLGEESPQMTLIRPPFGIPWYLNTLSAPSKKNDKSLNSDPLSTEEMKKLYSERVRIGRIVRRRGIMMLWTRNYNSGDSSGWVPGDWYEEGKRADPDKKEFTNRVNQMLASLTKNANGKGMVILFHDSHLTTVKVLPELITRLREKGYHFSTMERYVEWRWKKSSKTMVEDIRNNESSPLRKLPPTME